MPDSFINPAPHIKLAVSIISGKFAEINAVPVFDECETVAADDHFCLPLFLLLGQ